MSKPIPHNRSVLLLSMFICTICGVSFFFGFYFGMVKPAERALGLFEQTTCTIQQKIVNATDCSRKSDCGCKGCLMTPGPISCQQREFEKTSGACCDGQCCVSQICQPCTKYHCWGCSGKDKCCFYIDACCTKTCVQYSTVQCLLEWGQCFQIQYFYTAQIGDSKIRTFTNNCGFNDQSCVNQKTVNSTFDCWYNWDNANVQFSKPDNDKFVGGWVGATFGLLFWLIAVLLCCYGLGVECCFKKSSRQIFNSDYNEYKEYKESDGTRDKKHMSQPTAPPVTINTGEVETPNDEIVATNNSQTISQTGDNAEPDGLEGVEGSNDYCNQFTYSSQNTGSK